MLSSSLNDETLRSKLLAQIWPFGANCSRSTEFTACTIAFIPWDLTNQCCVRSRLRSIPPVIPKVVSTNTFPFLPPLNHFADGDSPSSVRSSERAISLNSYLKARANTLAVNLDGGPSQISVDRANQFLLGSSEGEINLWKTDIAGTTQNDTRYRSKDFEIPAQ